MTAALAIDTAAGAISARDVLELRAWARAYLWSIGEYDLAEAVDQLQRDAERSGLVAEFGQDAVQQILANAFAPYRDRQEQTADQQQVSLEPKQTQRRRTPQVTVEAVLHCVRIRGIGALQEPANVDRLARCDDAAQAEIMRRIAKLREQS
jgi:hypothetical protein